MDLELEPTESWSKACTTQKTIGRNHVLYCCSDTLSFISKRLLSQSAFGLANIDTILLLILIDFLP